MQTIYDPSLCDPYASTSINDESTNSSTTFLPLETATTRECKFFPTYAKRNDDDPSEWIIQTKGWALSHNCSVAKQKLAMGLTRNFAGKGSSADQSHLFEQRFKYFLAKSKRNKQFVIHAVGTTPVDDQVFEYEWDQSSSRRGSSDSGFQSSTSDKEEKGVVEEEVLHYDDSYQYYYFCPITDPLLMVRPGNPLSAILNGERRSCSLSSSSSSLSCSEDNEASNNHRIELTTDSNGFFSGELRIPHAKIEAWAKQHDHHCDIAPRLVKMRSMSHDGFAPAFGLVSLIEPKGVSIISDIDDTIKETQILAGARTVLNNTFFKPCRAVKGMAEIYKHWYNQGVSFHYVSNSPFQLLPMLDEFLKEEGFPPGSMHLRTDGSLLARLVEVPGRAKRDAITRILQDFPHRQFVLIGDSGEIDLEIYARIAADFPGRILKIWIRDVTSRHHQTLTRCNTFSSLFSYNRQEQVPPPPPPPSVPTRSSSDTAITTNNNLKTRIQKAKEQCKGVDIALFQDARTLRSDSVVRDAIWKS